MREIAKQASASEYKDVCVWHYEPQEQIKCLYILCLKFV